MNVESIEGRNRRIERAPDGGFRRKIDDRSARQLARFGKRMLSPLYKMSQCCQQPGWSLMNASSASMYRCMM